tara:strand:+ start:43 stop:180 length:138 start_codon:yes stop_codon:yes gene_type:complete
MALETPIQVKLLHNILLQERQNRKHKEKILLKFKNLIDKYTLHNL